MTSRIKQRFMNGAKGVLLGGACCTVIYATIIICSVKSILKMQINPVDY